jgi:hypothetical protein
MCEMGGMYAIKKFDGWMDGWKVIKIIKWLSVYLRRCMKDIITREKKMGITFFKNINTKTMSVNFIQSGDLPSKRASRSGASMMKGLYNLY